MICVRQNHPALVGLATLLLPLFGCSKAAIATHPVNGKVEYADGDVSQIAGSIIEFMQDADPLMRSSGKVQADGSFAMETLYQGEIIQGVPEGSYTARIIPPEEDESGKPLKTGPVHKRFLDFKTSGLSFKVPASDVTVKLSKM